MCVGISPRVSFKAVSACFSIDIFTSLHYFSLIHSSAVKKKDLFQYLTLKHSKSHMANKMKKSVYMYHASTQDCEWIFSCSQDRCRYNKWSTMLNKDKHSDMWLLCRGKTALNGYMIRVSYTWKRLCRFTYWWESVWQCEAFKYCYVFKWSHDAVKL